LSDIQIIIPSKDNTQKHVLGHLDASIPNEGAFACTCIIPVIPKNLIPKDIRFKFFEGT